jgi:threonine/homoserine/homoserine lactone efflux protein
MGVADLTGGNPPRATASCSLPFRDVPTLDTLLAFSAASIVLLLIPGPAVTYIVNRSVADGRTVALTSVAGVTLGNFMHVIAATVGLSAVLATSATAFNVVKWLGAAYLIGVGIKTLLTRPEALTGESTRTSYRRAFTQGVVVATLNPKVALFFLSFLPQFIDPDRGAAWVQSLVLGTLFTLLGAITDCTWAVVASAVRGALLRGRAMPFIRRYVSGSIFVTLGVIAARAQRQTA